MMSVHHYAFRLSKIFTPTYAARINAQIVHPVASQIVKRGELESAMARPLQIATYEPDRMPEYIAASLAYGLIKGHGFLDGNKRTAFFVANEYLRAQGLPGLVDEQRVGKDAQYEKLTGICDQIIGVASGQMRNVEDLLINTENS